MFEMTQHRLHDARLPGLDAGERGPSHLAAGDLQQAAIDQRERRDARDLVGAAAQAGEEIGIGGLDLRHRARFVDPAAEVERENDGEREHAVEDEELRAREVERNHGPPQVNWPARARTVSTSASVSTSACSFAPSGRRPACAATMRSAFARR